MTVGTEDRSTGSGSSWDDEFTRYFDDRARSLRATAYSLCGDWHQAEDIAQSALIALHRAWPRLTDRDALDGYARRVVLRAFLNERRRPWRGRERLTDVPPDLAAEPGGPEDRALVLSALSALAPGQRQVLVLRYWHDLSVEETAEELGLSTGAVKSQSARGLATLRKRLAPHFAVLASAVATVLVVVAAVLGTAGSPAPPLPVEPAAPPSSTPSPEPSGTPTAEPTSSSAGPP